MTIFTTIEITYDAKGEGTGQTCYVLLPHSEGSDVKALAQAYFDAKYGDTIYNSVVLSAKSVENHTERHLVDYARAK